MGRYGAIYAYLALYIFFATFCPERILAREVPQRRQNNFRPTLLDCLPRIQQPIKKKRVIPGGQMTRKVFLPIVMPDPLYRLLKRVRHGTGQEVSDRPTIDIRGERNIEWAFLSGEIPTGPGDALEFGCEQGYMSLVAAQRGFHVLANDLEPQSFCWTHPGVDFVHGDFLQLQLQDDSFDLIINCSSIEHVGVAGRYGITESDADDDGDLEVIEKIVRVLKPGGKFLMTGPCGKDAVLKPWCRVYGERRLPRLLQGLKVEREFFWRKNEANQWTECDRETALSFEPRNHPTDPHSCAYNLGCFALRK